MRAVMRRRRRLHQAVIWSRPCADRSISVLCCACTADIGIQPHVCCFHAPSVRSEGVYVLVVECHFVCVRWFGEDHGKHEYM